MLVPAHNEEASIARTIESLSAAQWSPRPELVVIADNCDDATAKVARSHGTTVLERIDPQRKGKGYALEWAIERLAERPRPPDVVAFVDADTVVQAEFFRAITSRLERGAEAVQLHYEAAPGVTDLARLRRLAFMLVHWARPLGLARLGLGSGLKGNGMAIRWDLARGDLGSTGITEDAAMTLSLARRGVAVAFAPGASVRGYMASRYRDARTQDKRWERGRLALLPPAGAAAVAALRRGRPAAAAAALEVAAPPLSLLAVAAAGALATALALDLGSTPLAAAAAASLGTYVAVGLTAARAPLRDVAALRSAPRFIAHKATVFGELLLRRSPASWQRTERR